jgi:probable rRNA maturation factor
VTIEVDVQYATSSQHCPSQADIEQWITVSLNKLNQTGSVLVRIVDEPEITQLNHQYRKKNKATNILSFPSQLPPELRDNMLGDMVICAPVLEKEAQEQQITLQAHWAHMVVHGTLHLLGHDHEEDTQAQQMESLEVAILSDLGIPDPYTLEKIHD